MKQNFTTKNRKNSDLIHCGRIAPFLLWGFPSDLEFLTLKVNMMNTKKGLERILSTIDDMNPDIKAWIYSWVVSVNVGLDFSNNGKGEYTDFEEYVFK